MAAAAGAPAAQLHLGRVLPVLHEGGAGPAGGASHLAGVGGPSAAGASHRGLPLQLAQDDAWKCPHCQALQQGVVKLSLWTLPDILIVHLKRFCQVAGRRNKLSTLVKFPLCGLNMAPHVAQRSAGAVPAPGPWPSWKQPACLPTSYPLDFLYDLYAVCNHHGSLQGGHYTGELCPLAGGCVAMRRGCGLGLDAPGRGTPGMPCRARAATRRELAPHPLHPGICQRAGACPGRRVELGGWWVEGGGDVKVSYGPNLRPRQV